MSCLIFIINIICVDFSYFIFDTYILVVRGPVRKEFELFFVRCCCYRKDSSLISDGFDYFFGVLHAFWNWPLSEIFTWMINLVVFEENFALRNWRWVNSPFLQNLTYAIILFIVFVHYAQERQAKAIQEALRRISPCPMGFQWFRCGLSLCDSLCLYSRFIGRSCSMMMHVGTHTRAHRWRMEMWRWFALRQRRRLQPNLCALNSTAIAEHHGQGF